MENEAETKISAVKLLVLILLGYVWGVVYLSYLVITRHWGAVVPLFAAVMTGYWVLRILVKSISYAFKSRVAIHALLNIFTNVHYMMLKAVKDQDPGCLRYYKVLILDHEQFKTQMSL